MLRKKNYNHNCLLDSEQNITILSSYYRQATSARNSSYPFISGDTFRSFADYVFDETRQDNLKSVKYGDIVFVKADMFHIFFHQPYNSIQNPFVLVTHNSDYSAPREYVHKLNDTKIIMWYASNPDVLRHSKLYPIPIGLANTRWEFGEIKRIKAASLKHRKPWRNRTNLLYVNFGIATNAPQREAALARARTFKNVTFVMTKISYETYLEQLGNTKFVLSPPGNGLDCHRTWEATVMGAAPIVISSGLDMLLDDMPKVIVEKWENLTERLLLSYDFSQYDKFAPPVICAKYWFERLLQHRIKKSKKFKTFW